MCVGLVTSWTNCSCARNLERRIGHKFYFVNWSCKHCFSFHSPCSKCKIAFYIPSVRIFLQTVSFFLGGEGSSLKNNPLYHYNDMPYTC